MRPRQPSENLRASAKISRQGDGSAWPSCSSAARCSLSAFAPSGGSGLSRISASSALDLHDGPGITASFAGPRLNATGLCSTLAAQEVTL